MKLITWMKGAFTIKREEIQKVKLSSQNVNRVAKVKRLLKNMCTSQISNEQKRVYFKSYILFSLNFSLKETLKNFVKSRKRNKNFFFYLNVIYSNAL